MSDDLAFSPDATPPWLRPEIPEHLRPLAAPPRPDQAPTVPGQRDTDATAPPESPAPPAPWASTPTPPGQPEPEPVTGRLRRTVTDLPAWDPLPPGEQLVRRPCRDL